MASQEDAVSFEVWFYLHHPSRSKNVYTEFTTLILQIRHVGWNIAVWDITCIFYRERGEVDSVCDITVRNSIHEKYKLYPTV